VVVGCRRIVGYTHGEKIRIDIKQIGRPEQIAPNRADVGRRHTLAFSDELLQRDVPLIRARSFKFGTATKIVLTGGLVVSGGALRSVDSVETERAKDFCWRCMERNWRPLRATLAQVVKMPNPARSTVPQFRSRELIAKQL